MKNLESELLDSLLAHRDRIFLICLGFTRNHADAEELAQEVFLKALKKISSLKKRSLAKEWLFRIARNTCLDFLKRKKTISHFQKTCTQLNEPKNNPESLIINRDLKERLTHAINSLSSKYRGVFVLKEYGDLSYQEISRALNIKSGTVMSRLNRARQMVLKHMTGDPHENK
jgi:RNA polymerase sigma-70 factor (ECF subfamily)